MQGSVGYEVPEPVSISPQSYVVFDSGWEYLPKPEENGQTLAIKKNGKFLKPKRKSSKIEEPLQTIKEEID